MTENGRAPAADVIDVFVAIDIPDVRALGAFDKKRFAADAAKRAHRRIHAAGNALCARRKEFGRMRGQSKGNVQRPTSNVQRSMRVVEGCVKRCLLSSALDRSAALPILALSKTGGVAKW